MRRLTLLIALALCSPALAIDVNDPPKGKFAEEWYAVMMQGAKSGNMHATMERIKRDSGDVIKTRTTMTMKAGRGDTAMTVTVDQTTEETLDGKPLSFSNRMKLGKMPMTTEGKFSGNQVTVISKQLGIATDKQVHTLPDGALMSWGIYRQQMDRGLKSGDKYSLSMYDPGMAPDKLITAQIEVFDKEQLDLFGRKVEAIKTRQTIRIPGLLGKEMEVPTTVWLTDEGDAVKLEMNVMEIAVEMIACPKSAALAKDEPAELMADTFIRVDQPVDANADALSYRLTWGEKVKEVPHVPTTDMQKIVRREERALVVTNTRHSARVKAKTPGTPLSDEERKACLASTSLLNYKDPVVAKLAKEAAGGEKDPHRLARKLRSFVSDYVHAKNLSVGFASASEVARSKEGDCTEHGVLLAALGRALGIPTRVVTGFVYTDEFLGKDHVFVGHLWTQFYLDGQWVDVDAALEQDDVDPTHLALDVSDGGDSGVAELAGAMWAGKPQITILPKVANQSTDSRTATPETGTGNP